MAAPKPSLPSKPDVPSKPEAPRNEGPNRPTDRESSDTGNDQPTSRPTEGNSSSQEDRGTGSGLFSPEGVIIVPIAIFFDLIGIIIFILGIWFGIDDYGILDTAAGIFFGLWLFIRTRLIISAYEAAADVAKEQAQRKSEASGKSSKAQKGPSAQGSTSSKAGSALASAASGNIDPVEMGKKIAKQAIKKYTINLIIEFVPFLGGLYPGWTIFAIRTLMKS